MKEVAVVGWEADHSRRGLQAGVGRREHFIVGTGKVTILPSAFVVYTW